MSPPDPGLYGRSFADVYDAWYGDIEDPAALIRALRARHRPGAVIVELGSGTGRLATPLCDAGFRVIAVDASSSMLRSAAAGPERICADMSTLPIRAGSADAAIVAYNTLFNLDSRAAQERCVSEAARVLRPGGSFVVDAFIAEPAADGSFGLSFRAHPVDPQRRLAILTGADPADPERIIGSHIELDGSVVCRPWRLVYRSPADLDACAARAGLALRERFADWAGAPFGRDAHRHVSWYERI